MRIQLLLKVLLFVLITNSALLSCSKDNIDLYSNLTAEQIYHQGKNSVQRGKFADAIKAFQALEVNYPYGIYADRAKLSLLHCYYTQKNYPQIKVIAERFLRVYPNHINADYVHYMQAVASYEQYYSTLYRIFNVDRSKREPTLAIEAFDSFKILLELFPNSKYAPDARKRMVHLKNGIAAHYLYIAKYYLAKGAYLAAANRAKEILTNFNDTIIVHDTLKLMATAYNKLGLPELAEQANNLLNTNFAPINIKSVEKKNP